MSGIIVPALYAISGCTLLTAFHHAMASKHFAPEMRPVYQLFAVLCLFLAAMIFSRASAYGAESMQALINLRRWETTFLIAALPFFIWFLALYTQVRPLRFLVAMCLFWAGLLVVNILLPYGIQYAETPEKLGYYQLPWGETLVDFRSAPKTFWYVSGLLSIQLMFYFGLYGAWVMYCRGERSTGARLAIALFAYLVTAIFNHLVNYGVVDFIHLSDFGIFGLLLFMDYELGRQTRDENRRAREVMDHLPAAISLKDIHGRYIHLNRRFVEIFGVGSKRNGHTSDADVFPPELTATLRERDTAIVSKPWNGEYEYEYEYSGGEQVAFFKLYQFPILQGKQLIGLANLHIDVTADRTKDSELDKLRHQVWRADRLANTSAISKSLAHEISQPLAAILNNAQAGLRFLASDPVNIGEIREIFEDIVRDEKRAGAVVHSLRSMLQQQEEPYAATDLGMCIGEVVDFLHTELIQRSVDTTLSLEPALYVWANKTQLQQVMINLIINAMEAMDAEDKDCRTLTIESCRADNQVRVAVRDSGHGIPPEKLDSVFEGFYTTKAKGLGIGLEICRAIMESHGGKIWAENNPDKGVTFTFSLPVEINTGIPVDSQAE